MIYRTLEEKWDAVVDESKELHGRGQPVLVGTVSVENSELVADRLKKINIPHNVLNAKYHEREAEIVAQAGRKGAVTIATNMAGRGTDILLGGNPEFLAHDYLRRQEINPDEATPEQLETELAKAKRVVAEEHAAVKAAGGLHILGTERHESRRIDNQLRGRAGRQGDPGSSRFVLSLEDDLMRIFAGDKVRSMMEWLGMEKGVAIESKTVSKQIERAQKAVEGRNFETRKHVLKYDDVMNKQRETIYGLRRQLMFEPEHRDYLLGDSGVARDLLGDLTHSFLNAEAGPDKWDIDTYAAESAVLRAQSAAGSPSAVSHEDAARTFVSDASLRVEMTARQVLAGISDGDMLRTNLAALRRLLKTMPADTVGARRRLAAATVQRGSYIFA